jgi:hypothetical protein
MASQEVSPTARSVEALLNGSVSNHLNEFLKQETAQKIETKGFPPSSYDIFAVRRNDQVGHEIFGPRQLHIGTYSEEELYGASGSPLARFRTAVQALKVRVEAAASMKLDDVEYGHQVALIWAEVGRLKEFIGVSSAISEIVAELRTARFQFLGKDTPLVSLQALASALRLIVEAKRLDSRLVDEMVNALEVGGVDSLAVDTLRESDG